MAKVREAIDLDREVLDAARAAAARTGMDVSEVIEAAVRRYVAGASLIDLLQRFSSQDARRDEQLTDDDAYEIAQRELDVFRSERRAG